MTPSHATDDDPPDDHSPQHRARDRAAASAGAATTAPRDAVAPPADVAPELHDGEDA